MYEVYGKDGKLLYYRISKRVTDANGNKKVLTARSKKSATDCRKVMNRLIQEWTQSQEQEKILGSYSEMKLANYAEKWYNLVIKEANCSKVNKDNYRHVVFKHIIPKIGDIRLCDLTEEHCQSFLNEYSGWSKTMIDKIRMTLRRILKKAVKEELIKRNFAEDIVRPTYTEGKRRPITDEEREWFIETAQTHYAGPMVLTMLWCGLRPIEVRRMTWDWIDFENNILTVGKSKTKAGTGRKIPIPTELSTMLKKLKLKGYNDEYVFVKYNNHCEMDGNSFYQSWRNFLREVEITHGAEVYRNQIVKHVLAPDLEPYLLRHTFCTDCQAAGVPINVAKELMGHSDIQVTAKIYTHMVDEVFETNRQRLQQYNEFKKHQSLA
ncbi:MAG: tyrosine-type recombinase/integrase [Eubacterium sp.]